MGNAWPTIFSIPYDKALSDFRVAWAQQQNRVAPAQTMGVGARVWPQAHKSLSFRMRKCEFMPETRKRKVLSLELNIQDLG